MSKSNKIRCITSVNPHGVRVATLHTSRASAIREVFSRIHAGHTHVRGRWVEMDTTPEQPRQPGPLYEAMHKPVRSQSQPAGVVHG